MKVRASLFPIALLVVAAVWIVVSRESRPAATVPAAAENVETPEPVAVDVESVSFESAVKAGEEQTRLRSLIVSWQDKIVLEHYFHGARANRATNVKSVSKTFISALVGIAIERGLLPGLDTKINTYFPALDKDADFQKRDITVGDLISMRAGLESTSSRNYGTWVQSPNWVRFALSREMLSPPGLQMTYSTGNTHLLSAILTQAAGKSTWAFARDVLAKPLGIELPPWPRDPQGIYFGGNDMVMTPRDMLAFGQMYLHNGRVNGEQIIPEAWIADSWIPRTRSRISGRLYGYGWWIRELAAQRVYYAWGFGGQFIFVIPSLEMVVVTTSSDSPGNDRRNHLGTMYDLVEAHVITPAATAMGLKIESSGELLPATENEP